MVEEEQGLEQVLELAARSRCMMIVIDACRACVAFVVMILGCVIAGNINGSTYYTLQPESLNPHCRVVVYPHDKLGVGINFGKYGNKEEVVDFGTFETETVVVKKWMNDEIEMRNSKRLQTKECDLHFLKKTNRNSFFMLETNSSYGLILPPHCAGGADGTWQLNGGDIENKGLWGSPVIASCVFWFPLRLMGIGFGHASDLMKDPKSKICMRVSIYFLFTVCVGIMISPIQNLQTSENCPQILTSYYSGRTSVIIASFASFLLLDLLFIVWALREMLAKQQVEDASCFIVEIFKFWCIFAKYWRDVGLRQPAGKDRLLYQILEILSASVALLPIVSIFGGMVYKIYEMKNLSFFVIFGLKVDLSLRFPEFDLSAKLNAFHVLAFLLWLMDIIGLLVHLVHTLTVKRYIANNQE